MIINMNIVLIYSIELLNQMYMGKLILVLVVSCLPLVMADEAGLIAVKQAELAKV